MAFDGNAYQRNKVTQIKFGLITETEPRLIAWIKSQPNQADYLRQLVLADMRAKGVETDPPREKYSHVTRNGVPI